MFSRSSDVSKTALRAASVVMLRVARLKVAGVVSICLLLVLRFYPQPSVSRIERELDYERGLLPCGPERRPTRMRDEMP